MILTSNLLSEYERAVLQLELMAKILPPRRLAETLVGSCVAAFAAEVANELADVAVTANPDLAADLVALSYDDTYDDNGGPPWEENTPKNAV